jgi:diguanylate cyclase
VQRVYQPGEVIFREGEPGLYAYLIETGGVELSVAGRARVLGRLGAGDLFGEVAIIERAPRFATAIAIERTVVTAINGEDLAARMTHSDPVVVHLMKTLIRRMEQQRGGAHGLFAKASDEALKELLTESEIRDGLANGAFEPFFQPIVSLADRRVRGYETLVRWRRGDGRLLPPGEFLPVAERSSRIQGIDLHILDAACAALALCCRHDGRTEEDRLFVSVNLAPVHFHDLSVVRQLERAIVRHGIAPEQLKIELTETALLANIDATVNVIAEIHALGVRLCLDDFGTGYSSLGYLYRIPIDTLKIDRTFVAGMASSSRARKLVKAILEIAAALDLETVVEGIEDEAIASELMGLGCTFGQGFLFGRPIERSSMLASHGVPEEAISEPVPRPIENRA